MANLIGFIIPLNFNDYYLNHGVRNNWCGTQQWWENENIQLSGTTSSTTAKVGDNVTIQVGIIGVGTGVGKIQHVQAWVCYPNTMPGRADASLIVHSMQPSNGGQPPSLDLSSNPLLIFSGNATDYQNPGTGSSYHLLSLTPQWVPQQEDILPPNTEAHCCIVATCSGIADASNEGGFPVGVFVANNSDLSAIDICNDPHQGQKNVTIVPLRRIGRRLVHEFGFLSGAARRDQRTQVIVEVNSVDQQGQIDPAVLKVLQSGPYHNLPLQPATSKPRTLGLRKNDHECQGWLAQIICEAEELIEELIEVIEGHEDADDRHGRRIKLTLPPNGLQPLVLQTELDPSDSLGTVHVFDIIQTDGDGQRGGIKLGVVVVP